MGRELGKLGADLVEREADALREDDEGDPAKPVADSGDGPSPPAQS